MSSSESTGPGSELAEPQGAPVPVSGAAALLANPFAAPVGPAAIVIFGAAGDLTKRKLVPALYNLAASGLLTDDIAIIGVARAELDDESFRARMADDIAEFATTDEVEEKLRTWILSRLHYVAGTFEDESTYARLAEALEHVDREHGTGGNRLYYMATAPQYFCPIVAHLDAAGLARQENGQWRRVIVEKPFGTDLASAVELNADLLRHLDEEQVYRIDHYLGKETVQNIMVFRFGNGMFEPIWNRRYIDNVQITVAESIGVEGRGGYYEGAGALRDMVPNHLLQLLALVAMEPPASFEAEAVRDERSKVLRAIDPYTPEEVLSRAVRGQYGAGQAGGKNVPGYRTEERVSPTSGTETFAAMRLDVDNWRWAGVPFYLRTGKSLRRRVSEISIQFKSPPMSLFRDTEVEHLSRNTLLIRVQPEEGISIRFGAKIPGPAVRMGHVSMDFHYADHFGTRPATGYETLLYDCIKGDATLFQRADAVELGWRIVDPLLQVWRALPPSSFPNYAAGTWGPSEAAELLARDGREWRRIGSGV